MVDGEVAVLDDPVGRSLREQHAHLAHRLGGAATYHRAVATFSAVAPDPGPQDWAELARLLGSGELADMFGREVEPPPDWEPIFHIEGRQMLWPADGLPPAGATGGALELGPGDAPEMCELVARTEPGPFRSRTHELGTYLGIRENGRLVAMAGERLRPPGWTEISAVCTAHEARGRGHATRLVRALIARITARGERPFLHAAETSTEAIALYQRIGFRTRKPITFRGFRTP